MIQGIHHVQITIPPNTEDEARSFWCGVMGLTEVEKPESLRGRGGLWLQAGNQQLHLGIEEASTPSRSHVAWQVTELEGWRRKLNIAGIETGNGIPIPGYDRFEFRDPFGNRVELIESLSSEDS